MVIRRIAVVGAGIAGLACASRLVAAGHEVKVYDKGRGVGGRAATRHIRVGATDLPFDHGAQFFTARDSAFRTLVNRLVTAGAIEIYPNAVTSITDTERSILPDKPRFVGNPGMNGLAKALADGLDVKTSCQVTECIQEAEGWTLALSTGSKTGLFDVVVIAVPAEQATELLVPVAPLLAQEAKAARTSPCWAAMLAFSPPLQVSFEAARVRDSSPLAWVAKMNGNSVDHSCWVLHATTNWSSENIDQSAEWVADELTRAFSRLAGSVCSRCMYPPIVGVMRKSRSLRAPPFPGTRLWELACAETGVWAHASSLPGSPAMHSGRPFRRRIHSNEIPRTKGR